MAATLLPVFFNTALLRLLDNNINIMEPEADAPAPVPEAIVVRLQALVRRKQVRVRCWRMDRLWVALSGNHIGSAGALDLIEEMRAMEAIWAELCGYPTEEWPYFDR